VTDTGAALVHYGDFEMLERCLASLCGQVSTVVVVNHDPDPVPRPLKSKHGAIVTWDEPGINLGFSRGVNRAIGELQTKFILVLNPDTILRPEAIAALENCLEQNPHLAMVGPRLLNPDGQLQSSSYRLPTLVQLVGHLLGLAGRIPPPVKRLLSRTPLSTRFGQLDPHDREKEVEMVSGACFLVRREALFDAGPMDPGFFLYYEEKDLCRRLWLSGWAVGFTPSAVAEHMIGGSAPATSSVAHRHRAMGALRYFQRHGNLRQRFGARLFLALYALFAMVVADERQEHRSVLRACLMRRMACGSCS